MVRVSCSSPAFDAAYGPSPPRDAERQDRQHVDDGARAPRVDHAPRGALRDPPGPFEIGADDLGPVVLGDVEGRGRSRDSRVVHEDVRHPERFLHRIESGLHAMRVGDVHPYRMGDAAVPADLACEDFEPIDAPCRKGHRGAVHGKGPGKVPAEAARRPGHERGAAVQFENRSSGHDGTVTLHRAGAAARRIPRGTRASNTVNLPLPRA